MGFSVDDRVSGHAILEKECAQNLSSLVEAVGAGLGRYEISRRIELLERTMSMMEQFEQPLYEYFCDGLYGRERHNPAGSLIITETHKSSNISILANGRIGIITENGIEVKESPAMFVTNPGTKRVIYAQTDVVFCTVHPNPTNTIDQDILRLLIIDGESV